MGYKILKDAGFVPPEVEVMRQIASVRDELARVSDPSEIARLRQKLSDLDVSLALSKDRLKTRR